MKKKFTVKGMTCASCVSAVEKAVKKKDGVKDISVNLMTDSMLVDFDENLLSEEEIVSAVAKAGYIATSQVNKEAEVSQKNKLEKNSDSMKLRLIISLIFMALIMYVAMGHMIKLPMPKFFVGADNAVSFAFLQLILTLPVVAVNKSYFIKGFRNLFKRQPNMDSLIALGASASLIYGIVAIFIMSYNLGKGNLAVVSKYYHELYFESAVMILSLITLGKYLESLSKKKTGKAIEKLIDLAPKTAVIIRDGEEITVLVEELKIGDTVIIKPGMAISCDGTVLDGESFVDESMVSGESVPIEKGEGSKVIGGTVNKNGFLKVSVSAVGKDTVLSKIIELVENAVATKAPIAKLADKIAGVFVPAVLLIAAISFVVWMIIGNNFEFSFNIAVSVLVISCPCALGLATPVAIMVGTGKGAENGILIKSSEALELSHLINTVAMDKTGTITYGKMKVASVANFGTNEQELISIAAGLEKQSEHPLGEAIIEYALSKGINIGKVSNFNSVTGKGISGEVENKRYYIGKLSYIEEVIKFSDNMAKGILVTIGESGQTPVIVANEEKILGIIAVADTVKENSYAAVKMLQSMGLKVIMLTGDNEITAKVIAKEVGINNYIANVLPENKEAEITELRKRDNKVAFVGDGINDAPALASADVGVAIGAGTDIAIQSADVVLMKNDLMDVVTLIKLSRATIRNVKENLFWAFFYNSIGIPLAAGVFYSFNGLKLNPMIGAFAMSLSSICVVLNALRLRYVKIAKGDKNMNELIIKVEGMSCSHCSKRVEEALNAIEGISATVDLKKKKATIISQKPIDINQIISAVEKAGYSAKLWK